MREKELAQREASVQNDQQQLSQQQALLDEASAAVEKERLDARDMLKVRYLRPPKNVTIWLLILLT